VRVLVAALTGAFVALIAALADPLIGTRFESLLYWLLAAGMLSIPAGYLLWRPTPSIRIVHPAEGMRSG
jgi:hypothetical protein